MKDLVAKLIEDAMVAECLEENDDLGSITDDHAWIGLDDVFELNYR